MRRGDVHLAIALRRSFSFEFANQKMRRQGGDVVRFDWIHAFLVLEAFCWSLMCLPCRSKTCTMMSTATRSSSQSWAGSEILGFARSISRRQSRGSQCSCAGPVATKGVGRPLRRGYRLHILQDYCMRPHILQTYLSPSSTWIASGSVGRRTPSEAAIGQLFVYFQQGTF